MQTQTATINGSTQRRRRYFRLPDELRSVIRADYMSGKKFEDIRRDRDVSNGAISNATADLPRRPKGPAKALPPKDERPVRAEGESTQRYAGRVMAWKLRTDPEFREATGRAKGDGLRRATHKRKMAALEAEREALAAERAALAVPVPVAAVEPPWGFQPPAPVEIPAPKPGFWRSIGMMLGMVR